jgi:hypothetical protein
MCILVLECLVASAEPVSEAMTASLVSKSYNPPWAHVATLSAGGTSDMVEAQLTRSHVRQRLGKGLPRAVTAFVIQHNIDLDDVGRSGGNTRYKGDY